MILKEGLADEDYIAAHCNGREEFLALVGRYDPTTAAAITGIDEDTIRQVARLYARVGAAMTIWAMGTREWSSCSGLPGYRYLENEQHRQEIGEFWGVDPAFFPHKRGLAQTDIFPAIESGEIKALWLVATNPMTSMPNTARIRRILEKLEFLVVQDSYADVETNQYSHVFFPASVWAEKKGTFTNTERRAEQCAFPSVPVTFLKR